MKHSLKKSVAIAGILSCLFASAAFAEPTMITPEQDKATQEAALQENKDYDKAHGYTNEPAAEVKKAAEAKAEAKAEKKAEPVQEAAAAKDDPVERDKATQEAALKQNREFDASHGYLNR